jgi:16S rRNA (adenine1518-N6/adenine1519-N6)-dimethyltransferase
MGDERVLLGAARVRELLERYEVHPSRSLGQNFVIDPNTITKMVRTAELAGDSSVLEIGAGAGSLTVALAAAAGSVVAVEQDPKLVGVLREVLHEVDNVQIVAADAMELDIGAFGADSIVSNLPYNLAATLVIRALAEAEGISRLTVMTQREVGERMAARPGSRVYGQTSAMLSFFARARIAARVSRRAFFPVPNVDSVIVGIERRAALDDVDRGLFFEVVKHAFSQRRKTLRNALAVLAGSAKDAGALLEEAGVDPSARAEMVDPEGFAAIARALATRV